MSASALRRESTPAPLWTAAAAAAATGGRATGHWTVNGVSIDSRKVAAGDLFVALPGERVDGHRFVGAALEAGAGAALVTHVPDGISAEAPLLVVDDALEGLTSLARAARGRAAARIGAITGSVGKTSTKEALAAILGGAGTVLASQGNLNNHIGAPLSLARLPMETEFAVFELGMNHAGEIRPLSRLVRPHVATVTTVAPAHLGFFESVEGIADAKAEIFEGLEHGGTAVLPLDNAHFERLKAAAEASGAAHILTFGSGDGADLRLIDVTTGEAGSRVTARQRRRDFTFDCGLPGAHQAMNALTALLTAQVLGVDPEEGAGRLAGLKPMAGRGARRHFAVPGGSALLIDDSYNASPAAMRAAFDILAGSETGEGGRRIAVLGDMLEMGRFAKDLHCELAQPLLASGVDLVFGIGPETGHLLDLLPARLVAGRADNAADLAPAIAAALRPGDVILVKGSLGMKMATVVAALDALGQS